MVSRLFSSTAAASILRCTAGSGVAFATVVACSAPPSLIVPLPAVAFATSRLTVAGSTPITSPISRCDMPSAASSLTASRRWATNPLNNPDHDAASDAAMEETLERLLAKKRRECAPAKAPGDGGNDGD